MQSSKSWVPYGWWYWRRSEVCWMDLSAPIQGGTSSFFWSIETSVFQPSFMSISPRAVWKPACSLVSSWGPRTVTEPPAVLLCFCWSLSTHMTWPSIWMGNPIKLGVTIHFSFMCTRTCTLGWCLFMGQQAHVNRLMSIPYRPDWKMQNLCLTESLPSKPKGKERRMRVTMSWRYFITKEGNNPF